MTAIASTLGNHGTTVSKAEEVRATPSTPSPSFHTPLMTIVSAVIVQITMVSMNGSSSATWPSVEGSLVLTAEWAIEADPMPASLEKAARWKPTISTPTTPPVMPLGAEGAGDDVAEGTGDLVEVGQDHHEAGQQVEGRP